MLFSGVGYILNIVSRSYKLVTSSIGILCTDLKDRHYTNLLHCCFKDSLQGLQQVDYHNKC